MSSALDSVVKELQTVTSELRAFVTQLKGTAGVGLTVPTPAAGGRAASILAQLRLMGVLSTVMELDRRTLETACDELLSGVQPLKVFKTLGDAVSRSAFYRFADHFRTAAALSLRPLASVEIGEADALTIVRATLARMEETGRAGCFMTLMDDAERIELGRRIRQDRSPGAFRSIRAWLASRDGGKVNGPALGRFIRSFRVHMAIVEAQWSKVG